MAIDTTKSIREVYYNNILIPIHTEDLPIGDFGYVYKHEISIIPSSNYIADFNGNKTPFVKFSYLSNQSNSYTDLEQVYTDIIQHIGSFYFTGFLFCKDTNKTVVIRSIMYDGLMFDFDGIYYDENGNIFGDGLWVDKDSLSVIDIVSPILINRQEPTQKALHSISIYNAMGDNSINNFGIMPLLQFDIINNEPFQFTDSLGAISYLGDKMYQPQINQLGIVSRIKELNISERKLYMQLIYRDIESQMIRNYDLVLNLDSMVCYDIVSTAIPNI